MKKLLVLLSVCAVLFSCEKEDPVQVDPAEKYMITSEQLALPAKAAAAMSITLAEPPVPVLSNIELTESGMYIAYDNTQKTKADPLAGKSIITGDYTSDNGYHSFVAEGVEVKIPAGIDAASITEILVGGVSYAASAAQIPAGNDITTKGICRTWYPVSYHISIMANGCILYNKESNNIMDLQKDFLAYSLGKEPSEDDLLFNAELDRFVFTNNHTAAVVMSGSIYEVCSWTEDGADKVKFTLNGSNVTASPYFKAGSPNTMYIIINPMNVLGSLGELGDVLGGLGGLDLEGLTAELESLTGDLSELAEGLGALGGLGGLGGGLLKIPGSKKGLKGISDVGMSSSVVITMVDEK